MGAVGTAAKALLLLGSVVGLTAAKRPAPAPVAPPAVAPVAPSIKQGVELWRAGNYPAAVAVWQPFAEAGDADAMFNMGQAYKLGRGVSVDAAAARDWYRKAAAKGHLPAQANLGIALFQAGEKPESIKWLRTAADRGEPRAQYVLGIAAFNGDGLARSQSLGYAYLLRAQASGLPQATTALGSIAPGLSPADRTAGEAVAASLAAGTGVPAALAATTAPRQIAPIRTPPTAAEIAALRPSATTPPPAPVAAQALNQVRPVVPVTAPAIRAPAATAPPSAPVVTARTLPPAVVPKTTPPEVAVARPIPEPTPAQADAAATKAAAAPAFGQVAAAVRSLPATPPVIATTDVPASKPVAVPPAKSAVDPLATPPAKPKPVTTAALKPFETADKPVAKKPDGWRVQLGAFSARKLADTAWADVKATAAPAKPIFATDGPVTKLQMGPYATRDAAKAACAKLTEAGRACFVTTG